MELTINPVKVLPEMHAEGALERLSSPGCGATFCHNKNPQSGEAALVPTARTKDRVSSFGVMTGRSSTEVLKTSSLTQEVAEVGSSITEGEYRPVLRRQANVRQCSQHGRNGAHHKSCKRVSNTFMCGFQG